LSFDRGEAKNGRSVTNMFAYRIPDLQDSAGA
jgi:hypothetical protein